MPHILITTNHDIGCDYITSDALINIPDECNGCSYYYPCDYCTGRLPDISYSDRETIYKMLGFKYVPGYYPDIVIHRDGIDTNIKYVDTDINVVSVDYNECKYYIESLIAEQQNKQLLDRINELHSTVSDLMSIISGR